MPNNKQMTKRLPAKVKRWFVAASGWGLDLNMGSGVNSTSVKQKRSAHPLPPDSRIAQDVKDVASANFLHNTLLTANIVGLIAQGTADANRLGDFIKLKTLHIRFAVDTTGAPAIDAAFMVRIMIVVVSKQVSLGSQWSSGLGTSDLFYSTGNNVCLGQIDPKKCKVLCDEIFEYQSTTGSNAGLVTGAMECILDAPFEYQSGTSFGTAANIYAVCVPYVAGGTTGTTSAGRFSATSVLTFESV